MRGDKQNMNIADVHELIEKNHVRKVRLQKLQDYYLCKNQTIKGKTTSEFNPNNKIAVPFAELISNFFSSYLAGQAITISGEGSEELQPILDYNDSQALDLETALSQSIFGEAWNYVWVDVRGNVRYNEISPIELIPVYDGTLENNLVLMVRNYMFDDAEYIEVYTDTEITKYRYYEGVSELISVEPHYFGDVPFIKFQNDKYQMSDFEKVMDLIDAYDHLLSVGLDEFDKAADSYICLRGMAGTSAEDLAGMREARALLLGEDDDAFFLEKSNTQALPIDALKRIDGDIHRFSCIPNLTDENLGSASGVAIQYRNQALDNKTNGKEAMFKKGLARRVELTDNIMRFLGLPGVDFTNITFTFTRSVPVDEAALVDNIVKLVGIVPEEILLAQVPFIEDVQEAIDMKYTAIDGEE